MGAGTVITSTDGDYYLLVNGAVSMKYGVPKGHLGPGEDMIDAAVRETYEETGIHLERSQLNLVKSILYKKIRLFKVTIDRNEHPNPVPVDTCEISHAKWFHKTQIHHLHDMTQLTRSILIRRI